MASDDIVGQVSQVLQPVVEAASMELVEVRFLVERGRRILRLYIDKPGGVTLEDCSSVSREASHLLDVHGIIARRYTLEVSSPGLDRLLRQPADFRRSLGHQIQVTARRPSSGTRTQVGVLTSFDEESITLKIDSKKVSIPRDQIVKAKLKPKF